MVRNHSMPIHFLKVLSTGQCRHRHAITLLRNFTIWPNVWYIFRLHFHSIGFEYEKAEHSFLSDLSKSHTIFFAQHLLCWLKMLTHMYPWEEKKYMLYLYFDEHFDMAYKYVNNVERWTKRQKYRPIHFLCLCTNSLYDWLCVW